MKMMNNSFIRRFFYNNRQNADEVPLLGIVTCHTTHAFHRICDKTQEFSNISLVMSKRASMPTKTQFLQYSINSQAVVTAASGKLQQRTSLSFDNDLH